MSGLSSINSNGIKFSGLASGIDSDRLIEGLLSVQRAQINRLKGQQARIGQQQSAFKIIEAKLLGLQSQTTALGRANGSVFDAKTVTSSNKDLVSAAASSSAAAGVYSFHVNALARAQQIASQGFADTNSTITQGTLQLKVGSGATTTITIDSTNNTLQGLVTAINSSGGDVSATLVNDGSGTQAQRLLLTAKKSGAANTISITNNLAASGGGAVRPELGATFVGDAAKSAGYAGTSSPTANTGAGNFTGSANNAYTFTVTTGGTVGTDNGIQLSYADTTGTNTGTITVDAADVGVFKNVAQGIQVQFDAGTLVAGDKFTIKGFVPNVQQAQDASLTVGSGSGAVTIASASNQVDGVFAGVTLNLLTADPTKEVSITVANDTDKAQTAVRGFVDSFNDLADFIKSASGFDAQTNQAGVLLGNLLVSDIYGTVTGPLNDVVAGVNAQANRLSVLGVKFNDQGKLNLDESKLTSVLSGQVSGVSMADVRRLFALDGTSSNPGVQFVTGTTKTVASATPYQVEITQAAKQATVLATNALAPAITITDAPGSENNTFTVKIDGLSSGTITLANGTYSATTLAQEVQGKLNADATLGAGRVLVSVDGNKLRFTSQSYGSGSQVNTFAGTALTPLGLAGTETGAGVDVVGKFVVNGVDETATGTGQFLKGDAANANTAELQVRVTLGDAQLNPAAAEADLTVTRGIASRLDQLMSRFLDPVNGRLKSADQVFQQSIEGIDKSIARQEALMKSREEALVRQFAAMEAAVAKLKSMGDYLTGQFASISALNKK